jgi:fumarylpyruvate hydrolase
MMSLFDLPAPLMLPLGDDLYPVGRIFCVGRNYAAHAAEMGNEVDREAPFYFTKSARHAMPSGTTLPYPPATSDLHHEVELVVALGAGGVPIGYGTGLDMTRRDLQGAAKDKRRPWDTSKDFEGSAVLGPLARAEGIDLAGLAIRLAVNGETRQDAGLDEMIHDVPAILADLERLYRLGEGDLIMSGTPAGVAPVGPGDHLVGTIDRLPEVTLTLADPD